MARDREGAPPRPGGEKVLRVASITKKGMNVDRRQEVLANFTGGKLDIARVQEMHIKGCRAVESIKRIEC